MSVDTVADVTLPAEGAAAGPEGAAAEAIRAAETALARQSSVAAQVDLQVVTAVLNAHAAHADGAGALAALKAEIEAAVATRTDLDTPAGAREFQRYLIDKLRDIRAVVEQTDLDDTSKATLAAALASLYATASGSGTDAAPTAAPAAPPAVAVPAAAPIPAREPDPIGSGPTESDRTEADRNGAARTDLGPLDLPGPELFGDPYPAEFATPPGGPDPVATPPASAPAPAAAMPAIPSIPSVPSLGGGSGLAPLSALAGLPGLAGLAAARNEPPDDAETEAEPGSDATSDNPPGSDPDPADDASPLADVIAEAVSGTPIPEAFDHQGISIPDPGSPVGAPLDPAEVVAGDIALLGDRHALALGNGRALIDDQIQPIETVNRPGFLGWQHPPEPDPETASPD